MTVRAGARAGTTFPIFQEFPELHVGLFGKTSHCSSDEACARQLGFREVATLNQVHGNVTHVVEKSPSPPPDGDGLITVKANLALSIRFADCQAFVIYAPRLQMLGVLHVGWRSLAKAAITAFFATLKENFDVQPAETFVGAGPSLCKHCATFSKPYEELPENLHAFIDGRNVDLIAAADAELDSLGVPRLQRERHPSCTRCDERFWSYRRDRNPQGRNYLVAGMMVQ